MTNSHQQSRNLSAYRGHIVSPIDGSRLNDIRDGLLVVDENGQIVFVGAESEFDKDAANLQDKIIRRLDFGKRLIMPGMVDTHLHLPQVTATGKSGEHLMNWLQRFIFPSEIRCRDAVYARKIAKWFFDEMACNGTTTGVVMTTVHKEATDIAFQIASERGLRVIMGKMMMNANAPPELTEELSASLSASHELCQKWHGADGGRLMYAFTPRFAPTSTSELLKECGKLWQESKGSYLHTHLAESQDEIDFVKGQYPSARSYVDVYHSFGLLGKNSVMAHSIHLDEQDIKLLRETDSSLAHCPSSNFFLKSGVFQYNRILKSGIRFGLGSDVAAGPQMSLFCVMKDANYMQPHDWLGPEELLYRATLGGARALALEARIGSLDAGKEADFIVVDPRRRTGIISDILDRSIDEILSALVFLGDDRIIDATFVRGRQLFSRENQESELVTA